MSIKSRRDGRIPMFGTWITERGAEVYRLLGEGMKLEEVASKLRIPKGSMSGYLDRAIKFGVVKAKKRRLKLVAVSEFDGSKYEFVGKRMIEKEGFTYTRAYYACTIEGSYLGFKWHFEERKHVKD